MKRINKIVAVLAVGFLLPSLRAVSEPDLSYSTDSAPAAIDSFNEARKSSLARSTPVLNSFRDESSGGLLALKDVDKKAKEIEKNIADSQEQLALRSQIEKGRKDIDNLKIQNAMPSIYMTSFLKKRAAQNDAYKQLYSLPNTAANLTGNAAINTSGLDASCKANVDFSQYSALSQMMGTDASQNLFKSTEKLVAEREKEDKHQKALAMQDLFKRYEDAANGDSHEGASDKAKNKNAVKSSVASQKAVIARQESERKSLSNELVKETWKLMAKAEETKEMDQQVMQELVQPYMKQLTEFRLAALQSASQESEQLRVNCQAIVDRMNGNRFDQTNLKSATMMIQGYYAGSANGQQMVQQFQKSLNDMKSKLKCDDVATRLDGALGQNSPIGKAIAQLNSIRDPQTLMTSAMNTLKAMGAAQKTVNESIQPLMNDCNYAAKSEVKLKELAANTQAAMAQSQGPMPQQQAMARGGRRGGMATH